MHAGCSGTRLLPERSYAAVGDDAEPAGVNGQGEHLSPAEGHQAGAVVSGDHVRSSCVDLNLVHGT